MATKLTEQSRGGLSVSYQQAGIVDKVLNNNFTVVNAGAGSGKTHTTIATILEILDKRPNESIDQFAIITFTNDAADELRHRIESTVSNRRKAATSSEKLRWIETLERLPSAYIGTIHGFCRQILRAFGYGSLVARESDVEFAKNLLYESIADAIEMAFEQQPEHPLKEDLGIRWNTYDLERIIREIYEHIRNRGLYVNTILKRTEQQPEDPGKRIRVALMKLIGETDKLYTKKKNDQQKVDAADLLLRTAELLEDIKDPEIVKKLGKRYRYLFIDEFQDTDLVQMRLVDSLRPVLKSVLLVGDEKQSIYRFRGAGMRLSALAKARGVSSLSLSISRRPTLKLLKLQNTLFEVISENYKELNQPLEPSEDAIESKTSLPSMVYIYTDDDLNARMRATANKICSILRQQIDDKNGPRKIEVGDIAILFRSNANLDKYEAELNKLLSPEVKVRKMAGGQFFLRTEIIAAYRLLRLILDFPNDLALSQALRTPYLQIDASAIENEIMQFGRAREDHIAYWFQENCSDVAKNVHKLRSDVRVDTVPELIEKLFQLFKMREFHWKKGEVHEVNNLECLREMARNLTSTEQALTLRAFVRWLQIRILSGFDEPDAQMESEEGNKPNYVRLMTIHKSKGLEFPIVIIPEVQARLNGFIADSDFIVEETMGFDGKLPLKIQTESPNFKSLIAHDDNAERVEAMRLFYVAVTRAQNSVIFIGSGGKKPLGLTHPEYSWKDEIRRAWPKLVKLGAEADPATKI